jgi:hypothetical protein
MEENYGCDQWGQGGVSNLAPIAWYTIHGNNSLYEIIACSSTTLHLDDDLSDKSIGQQQQDENFAPAIQILEGPSCQLMSCVPSAGANSSSQGSDGNSDSGGGGCTTVYWHSMEQRRYHILVFGQEPSTVGNFAIRLVEIIGSAGEGNSNDVLLRPDVFSKSGAAALDILVDTDGGGVVGESSLVADETPPVQSCAATILSMRVVVVVVATCFASMLALYL